MSFLRFAACTVALLFTANPAAFAGPSANTKSSYMRVHGQALPPYGFVQFCQRNPRECAQNEHRDLSRFDATPVHLHQLDQINRRTNAEIAPVTDQELYGNEEYWTLPTTQGDCEDYVLLKRKRLMALGWPAGALLITVVRDEQGDGHAVLTVRTRQGDFVLDNKVDEVRLWNQTAYQYLMRQSYLSPILWMALDPRIENPATSVAGVNAAR